MYLFIECAMNLDDFIDMSPVTGEGEVMDYKSFIKHFTWNIAKYICVENPIDNFCKVYTVW